MFDNRSACFGAKSERDVC